MLLLVMKKEEKMFELIRGWEGSSLDRQTYCKRHKIKIGTFAYWRSKYLKTQHTESGNESDFVTLSPALEQSIEVVYPNGVQVRLPAQLSVSDLSTLIHLV